MNNQKLHQVLHSLTPRSTLCLLVFIGISSCSSEKDASSIVPEPELGDCPAGSVCGSGEPVACEGPAWFSRDAKDSACTPAAFCPPNSVCGSGMARVCSPQFNFAASPLDITCTEISACPQLALCEQEGLTLCSASCLAQNYQITNVTSPTREAPWEPQTDEALVALGREDAAAILAFANLPGLMAAHPARQSVPGILSEDAPFIRETVTLNLTNNGKNSAYWYSSPGVPIWLSTGLFARAGTVFTVEVAKSVVDAANGNIEIQVGSHNDTENVWGFPYNQPIRRFPEIVHRWPLGQSITAVTSAFGGLVYIRIREGTELGDVDVTFTGTTSAPLYVHGVTDAAQWNETIRHYHAPWAELVGDKVALTVRSSDIREVDVVALMEFWEQAMDAAWYLTAIGDEGHRRERYAADPAIEGIAHSGYPVAMAEQWSTALVDISEQAQNNWWTTFHELGHNFQFAPSTWTGLQEASCNLWALYVLEQAAGLEWKDTHPNEAMGQVKRTERIQAYVDGGRNFADDWQTGFNAYQGFLPLEVFMQLIEGFGWDLIHHLNRQYRALAAGQIPYLSHDKIQAWVIASSLQAGVSLEQFYLDWGFPINTETSQAIIHLPDWEENPMSLFD